MSYKGKGGPSSSMSYKGKGGSSSSMSYKGKGDSSTAMSYKGKGGPAPAPAPAPKEPAKPFCRNAMYVTSMTSPNCDVLRNLISTFTSDCLTLFF